MIRELLLTVLCLATVWAADDLAAIRAALDRGDLQAAEKELQARLERQPADADTARLACEIGLAFGKAGHFDRAELLLTYALAGDPANFKALYNLGVAASYAGHSERAREVLETALRLQPQNVDVLYSLAYVRQALKQWERAVGLLARGSKLAPNRADIQKLLAISTTDLRAYDDAAAAWNRYLTLEPNNELARRERGAALVRSGQIDRGLTDLEWYLSRHADDASAHYEIGLAKVDREPDKALLHLDQAIKINPEFVAARSARGSLYYQMGKPEAAVTDLEFAAGLAPIDAAVLDHMGQTYIALDRPEEAVRVLAKAAELAPDDSKIQLHFGRALADVGRTAESEAAMEHFRQLGPAKNTKVPAGLVEYLSLTAEQRTADYRARVEKAVRDNPDDPASQLRYLKLLLEEGKSDDVAPTVWRLMALKPNAGVLADAGRMLLEFRQYAVARDLLQPGALDHAIATFRATGAAEGMRLMDRVPRSEAFHFARAQMLIAVGRLREAIVDLDQAPESRHAQLLKAGVLELDGQADNADRLLKKIQTRWPEWYPVWRVRGIILSARGKIEESRQSFQTAKALGARNQPKDLRTFLLMPPEDW